MHARLDRYMASLITGWTARTWRISAPAWRASPACSAALPSASSPARRQCASPCGTPRPAPPDAPDLMPGWPRRLAEIYQVTHTQEGLAAAQAPTYARLVCFDGPRAPEQAAAEDLAGRQRIWPAIRGLSGLVGIYVLRGSDLSSVIVTLATSVETLGAAQRAVMATELTPGEDPALLPGPDRVEIHRITGRHLPAAGPVASTTGH